MIRTFTFSAAGGHPANEDAFLVQQLPGDPEAWLVCLADGQGGRAGGAKAARLACDTAAAAFRVSSRPWDESLSRADAAVAADPEAGFATLIGFDVGGDRVAGASCGDSAVLAVCGSGKLTELTAHQFKNPPVGSGAVEGVEFGDSLKAPWILVGMTDGVWKYAGWDKLVALATANRGRAVIDAALAACRLRSGALPDDFTMVVWQSN